MLSELEKMENLMYILSLRPMETLLLKSINWESINDDKGNLVVIKLQLFLDIYHWCFVIFVKCHLRKDPKFLWQPVSTLWSLLCRKFGAAQNQGLQESLLLLKIIQGVVWRTEFPPLVPRGYIPRSPVDAWNCGEYRTLYTHMYYVFSYTYILTIK